MSYALLTPFERHRKLLHDYVHLYRGKLPVAPSVQSTDLSIMEKNHRFIRCAKDDAARGVSSSGSDWEARMAAKYYSRLFKEYALVDLSRYKEGKVGMRWRVETEVVSGKGQFVCSNLACEDHNGLSSYEVNFGYMEDGQKKNALVKVRLCVVCKNKMNYKREKALVKKERRKAEWREEKQRKRRRIDGSGGSDSAEACKAGPSHPDKGAEHERKKGVDAEEAVVEGRGDSVWQSDAAAGISSVNATAEDVEDFLESMLF